MLHFTHFIDVLHPMLDVRHNSGIFIAITLKTLNTIFNQFRTSNNYYCKFVNKCYNGKFKFQVPTNIFLGFRKFIQLYLILTIT